MGGCFYGCAPPSPAAAAAGAVSSAGCCRSGFR